MRTFWLALLTMIVNTSFASTPIRSEGHAEICFLRGSETLSPGAKITLIRLLHSSTSHESANWTIRAFGDVFPKGKDDESTKLGEKRAASIKQFISSTTDQMAKIEVFAHPASRDLHPKYTLFQIYMLERGMESECWAKSPRQTPAIVRFSNLGCLVGSSKERCFTSIRCGEDGCTHN